ncbi:MAG: response regulator [Planctomycetes bacterium]|nr:response regulator [Planctomycetota bacterium]
MQKVHVMVIDDDLAIRELLYRILAKKDYEVTTAVGAEQALQLLEKEKPDLIVVDLKMPGMDGLSFVKKIRTWDKSLPIIMLTGFGDELVELEAKKAGVQAFLRKDMGINLFTESVNKLIDPKRLAQKREAKRDYIMVVDDDAEVRSLLQKFLVKKDYEVASFQTAEQALEEIDKRKPHLVLLDINLPGMDGITALKKLKENHKDIGVIMISSNTELETAKQSVSMGAYDYIMKPFNMEYLELCVLTKIFLGEN